MRVFADVNDPEIVGMLRSGAVGILRTDTLYGIVCQAASEQAVTRVYRLKDRNEHKSPIVLIASRDQLFDVPSREEAEFLGSEWPEKTSVIIASKHAPKWLRRGNDSVAYRIPADENLKRLLTETGPLIAPSANPEGQPPAMNVDEARNYFDEHVDFYVDGGHVDDATPSRLLKLKENGEIEWLR